MSAYRVAAKDHGTDVTLFVRSSALGRFGAALGQTLVHACGVAIVLGLFGSAVLLFLVGEAGVAFVYVLIVVAFFVTGGALVGSVRGLAAAARWPAQLPRSITFAERFLIVEPAVGPPYETDYGFVARALESERGVRLVLQERPFVEVRLPRSAVSPDHLARILELLAFHGRA